MKLGPYLLGPNDTPENGIYTGDARELAKLIPDESVDLVLTDPPYLREFIPLYEWLARESSRILKAGGYVFAYGAGEHMPARLAGMEASGLSYFWTYVLLHHGGYPRMWNKRLMSGYKPIFVYTKGKPLLNPWQATVHAVCMDKRFHHWGQGVGFPVKMIDMLTLEAGIIVDFCCGGGQMPAAAVMTGRRYLAFEIDPDVAEIARERVRNTQPPLFVPEMVQEEMVL